MSVGWLVRTRSEIHDSLEYFRDAAETERRVAEETIDIHLIPDLARVVGGYLCE
jgi:hypothetical protein